MKPNIGTRFAVAVGAFAVGMALIVDAAFAEDTAWEAAMPRMMSSGGEISVERGSKLFSEHCVNCHGVRGMGAGFKKYSWQEEQFIPDLTDAEYMADRGDEIALSLDQGRMNVDPPLVGMPAFHYILSTEDQKSILAYIKTLQKKAE